VVNLKSNKDHPKTLSTAQTLYYKEQQQKYIIDSQNIILEEPRLNQSRQNTESKNGKINKKQENSKYLINPDPKDIQNKHYNYNKNQIKYNTEDKKNNIQKYKNQQKTQKPKNTNYYEEIGLDSKYPIIQRKKTTKTLKNNNFSLLKPPQHFNFSPQLKKITKQQYKLKIELEYPDTDPRQWTYKQLKEYYQKNNKICKSNHLGVTYTHSHYDKLINEQGLIYKGQYRGNHIHRIKCKKFQCDRCRKNTLIPKLKKKLNKAITEHQLYTHIVITTEGEEYRKENNYYQSYIDMSRSLNKIRKILSEDAKKQGKKFTYINLIRAQKNGYCHLHILTDMYIPKKRLQDISDKYFNTGFIKVKSVKDIDKYLTNDFEKDHEFYIPFGRRHYTTSRNIDLNIYEEEKLEFNQGTHIHLIQGIPIIDQVYDKINQEYGYPPPLDFLLTEYKSKVKIKDPIKIKWKLTKDEIM